MKKPSAYAFKHKVQRKLENEHFIVAPIADSTFPIDLLAFREDGTRGYRIKAHGKIYDAELQTLRKLARELKIKVFTAKENAAREIIIWDVNSRPH